MLLSKITSQVSKAFAAAGFADADPKVKVSDRPELSDFQSNGAMALAKSLRENPREIADRIRTELLKDDWFSKVTVDGPGFINLTVRDDKLTSLLPELLADVRLTVPAKPHPEKVVMDYGGPNVAKALHVGHLRPAIIGEALKRLQIFVGDTVISDVHLGDWGKPMGLIIEEIKDRKLDVAELTEKELEEIYPAAVKKASDDEAFLERAKISTKALQDGDKDARRMWEAFREISLADIKHIYRQLDVSFDLWYGESSVDARLKNIVTRLIENGTAVLDDGAYIIRLSDDIPPFMLVKSDGAVAYAGTDLATIDERVKDFHARKIIYVTDDRQSLHFRQVFEASRKSGIAPENVQLVHAPHGSITGPDGKPFKTRDGGKLTLSAFLQMAKDTSRKKTEDPAVADQIALSAIKFADLMNDKSQSYIFDMEKFLAAEGKTGPYVLYAAVRIRAILEKAGDCSCDPNKKIVLSQLHPAERSLLLHLYRLPDAVLAAYERLAPHLLVEHLFVLAQLFSTFYHDCHVLNEENTDVKYFRLCLLSAVLKEMHLSCGILGLSIPDRM